MNLPHYFKKDFLTQIIHLRKRYREILLGVRLRSVCERCFISQVPFTSVDMDQVSVSSSLKFGRDRTNYRATVAHPFNYTLKQLEVHSLSERRGRKYNQQVRSWERAAKYKAVILYLLLVYLSSQRIAEPDIILKNVKSTKCYYLLVSKPPALFPFLSITVAYWQYLSYSFSIDPFWMVRSKKCTGASLAMKMRQILSTSDEQTPIPYTKKARNPLIRT